MNEIEDLLKAISRAGNDAGSAIEIALNLPQAVAASNEQPSASEPRVSDVAASGSRDVSQLATEVVRLTEATRASMVQNVAPAKQSRSSSSSDDESGIGETILDTAGKFARVVPIVTGIMRLFGGGGEPEPLPELQKFELPGPVALEAGLTTSRKYGSVRYTSDGRPETPVPQLQAVQSPTIQVNIQALDSQSFLDRRDDIAKAVREAMLHSNSLNDVVQEL